MVSAFERMEFTCWFAVGRGFSLDSFKGGETVWSRLLCPRLDLTRCSSDLALLDVLGRSQEVNVNADSNNEKFVKFL